MTVLAKEEQAPLTLGMAVRVKASVLVYHHPDHRGQAHDIQGLVGHVTGILHEWQGRPISANYPYCVKFSPKFSAHLQANELEPCS